MDTPAERDPALLQIDPWDDPPLDAAAVDPPWGAATDPSTTTAPADAAAGGDGGGNWMDVVPPAGDVGGAADNERKVPRNLHLWLAGALTALTLAVLGLQTWLARPDSRAVAAPGTAVPPADSEPPLSLLQHELARQRGDRNAGALPLGVLPPHPSGRPAASATGAPAPLPPAPLAGLPAPPPDAPPPASVTAFGAAADGSLPGLAALPAGDSAGSEPGAAGALGGDASYEQAKAQAVIAGSRILALSHTPASGADSALAGPWPASVGGPSSGRVQALEGLLRAAPELLHQLPVLLGAARDAGERTTGTGAAEAARSALPPGAAGRALRATPGPAGTVILEGTPIPCVLQTELRSDLPGMIVAQVADDVYDSVTAQRRLIPRGTRLVGHYDSQVAGGQQRLMASFHRMILPGGASIELERVGAADVAGSAGLQDQVDTHFWSRFGQAFLTAGLARAAQRDGSPATVGAGGGVLPGPDATGQILVDTARTGLQQGAALAPTLIIRRGTLFHVMVNRDLQLPEWGLP